MGIIAQDFFWLESIYCTVVLGKDGGKPESADPCAAIDTTRLPPVGGGNNRAGLFLLVQLNRFF